MITGFWAWQLDVPVPEEPAAVVDSHDVGQEKEPEEISVSIAPDVIRQGDPGLIVVNGTSTVRSINFNGKNLWVFSHEGKPASLIGFDLRGNIGTFPLIVTLRDGTRINERLIVTERVIKKAPLGIPDKLGGDTPESERALINTLVQEGAMINAIESTTTKLWSGDFQSPVTNPVVSDVYGYSRQTGSTEIAHKGTDFRAPTGTQIYAMNFGQVAFVREMRNYGKTIVIDHGLGLLTIYMHLSEINVSEGQMVPIGQEIGKSGQTGYAFGPHLHLTVRINGISIDPVKFMALFGE
ncbi:MAG: M23 family metallopeptidase [bacterium]|nr:M23 family metallopeptidase [bacterium]